MTARLLLGRKSLPTPFGIALLLVVVGAILREFTWLVFPLTCFAIFLVIWGRAPSETEGIITQLPGAKSLLKVLDQLDMILVPRDRDLGMRQRVAISIALSCEPKLLIADEPTTALEVTIQAQILDLLAREQRRRHMAMILITHDLALSPAVPMRSR